MPIPIQIEAFTTHGKINRKIKPFNNYTPDLLDYLDKIRSRPNSGEVTLDYLLGTAAPLEFIALLRGKARIPLLHGLRSDEFFKATMNADPPIIQLDILDLLNSYCCGDYVVGDIEEQSTDMGESQTLSFPIYWPYGQLVIEGNDAWGFHWKLINPDLTPGSEMLRKVQNEYGSESVIELQSGTKSLRPSTLAEFMNTNGFDIRQLTETLHASIKNNFTNLSTSTCEYFDLTRFDPLGARLIFKNPETSFAAAFELGSVYGDKAVRIDDPANKQLYSQLQAYDYYRN